MKKITLIIPVLLALLLSCDVVSKVEDDRWPEDATPFMVNVTPGESFINLNWDSVEGAAIYEVWYNTVDDYTTATRSGGDITTTGYTITGLTNGNTYYLWVNAKDAEGVILISRAVRGIPGVNAADLAKVSTDSIRDNPVYTPAIAGTSALAGGQVIEEGSSPVIDRGVCWSTNPDPTTLDPHASAINATGTGTFTQCSISPLIQDTVYYVRAYATNKSGTAYGVNTIFNSGKTFGIIHASVGGYVFFNNGYGQGLAAAETDITAYLWCSNSATVGITKIGIGEGKPNSNTIYAFHGAALNAAKVCIETISSGKNDWFLPSRNELYLMRKNLYQINASSFLASIYWTSSEGTLSTSNAEAFDFTTNIHTEQPKPNLYNIRQVREF